MVRTKDGWAVQHAVITATDGFGNQVVRAEADAEGTVVTAPLVPGVYTAVVTAVGYTPVAFTAIATASGTAELGTIVLTRQGGVELPPPGVWTIDPAHSKVAATAQHLGLSSVHGRFARFRGRMEIGTVAEASRVVAEIDAASIDTGNSTRDDHLRSADFLNVATHPTIFYRSTGLSAAGPDRWTLRGDLNMAGITRTVDLDLSYLGTSPDPWGGLRAAFRATTELHREHFAMNYNQVVQAGISLIGATLKVELDIQAVQGELPPS
ncbi:YceI family protein [Streptosporangium lutulentum]|uniref:Polyisoprenoid-binding protein YceI n=1 Tax=Streptosporangium lutulentum TaxID=1461250 RepID=A0ABT9QDX7_9ACTN|nr:YceI family protein [Streptosporangium lutulentum]MDP9844874.1 polyisoprenoid-binding protein YceI [Streptosporangium lutulentum]